MKKRGVLNRAVSSIIASMGHGDRLVICDSGLPIPKGAEIADLALTVNIPRFIDTLKVVAEELEIEAAVVAEEMAASGSSLYRETQSLLPKVQIRKVPHDAFKEMLNNGGNIAFIRTGEATPYANIILVSGVTFT
ncbi:D-ribose pyranase [bacterium]|nr:D-ribose pyranase [bacterium]